MTWVLVDGDYLAHRAFHSTGQLSHEGRPTGVLFGFLREVWALQERYGPALAFCWDDGPSLRKRIHPGYKAGRAEKYANESPEEQDLRAGMRDQATLLKTQLLTRLGFHNVFFQTGYEADDVIARIVQTHPDHRFVVVSADKDLYQVLSKRVSLWNPQTQVLFTKKDFVRAYGLLPRDWVTVKALAGCGTDDIPGLKGVGEKTAAAYLSGSLPETRKIFLAVREGLTLSQVQRNKKLVRLPYAGKPPLGAFALTPNGVTKQAWAAVAAELGMKSLRELVNRRTGG